MAGYADGGAGCRRGQWDRNSGGGRSDSTGGYGTTTVHDIKCQWATHDTGQGTDLEGREETEDALGKSQGQRVGANGPYRDTSLTAGTEGGEGVVEAQRVSMLGFTRGEG